MIRGPFSAALVVLLARDSFSRWLRWLAARNILTSPVAVEELSLTPNPNAWLVEWLRRRDASQAVELARSLVVPALVIAAFAGFAEGPGSTPFRAKLAALCAVSLFVTRIAFWRVLDDLAEADILATPPQLVQIALRKVSSSSGHVPDLHPIAYSPALLLVAGALVGVLLYLDTASDATAVAALVLLPLAFPLYVVFSKPRGSEVMLAAEKATSQLLERLALSPGLASRSKPRGLVTDQS